MTIQEQIADAVEFALIEQLGGYENVSKHFNRIEYNAETKIFIGEWFGFYSMRELKEALLQYRREHNIFDVGDDVACLNSRRYKIYKFPSNKDHWLNFEEIRHAKPEEIAAGHRL